MLPGLFLPYASSFIRKKRTLKQFKSDFFELSVCVLCFYRVIHQQDESKSETSATIL
ncbi:hypothetical protein BN1007_150201 [Klebsiella variicola]|nr:hypothetical protein BN1007_130203 [Klebsiella variicola]CTQ04684.1 hypothetical protein BN1007_150201 [Klebsiella variicola]